MTQDVAIQSAAAPVDHSKRRERRIAASSIAALATRALGVAVSIVSIPLVIGYLGPERFGLWVTVTAFTTLLTFADLGLGNGLLNIVSESEGKEDRVLARRAVSTTFFLLLAMAAILIAGTLAVAAVIPWAGVFGTSAALAEQELAPGLVLYIVIFAVGLPLSVAERTRLGLQESYTSSAWGAVGTIGWLVGILVAVSIQAPLPQLVLLSAGPPLLAAGLNAVHLFLIQRRWICPSLAFVAPDLAPRLIRLGFLFFVLQVAVSVAFQSDIVVAASVLGPEEAAVYSVAARVFLFVPGLIAIVLATLWPAYGEAIQRGDISWVTRTLRRSVVGSVAVATIASIVMVAASPMIFELLTGGSLAAPMALLIGFAIWAVVSSAFNAVSMVLNAAGVLRFQVIVASAMAATSIILSITLARSFGVAGVIWGTLLAYVVVTGIPVVIYMPRFIRALRHEHAQT